MSVKEKKIESLILFFANNQPNNSIDRVKLMKLIWLSDRLHMNKYSRLIIKDNYRALPHGPIASDTLRMTNQSKKGVYNVKRHKITAEKSFDIDYFSSSDLEIMSFVQKKFGKRKTFDLRDFSHEFPEWKRYENELNAADFPNSFPIVMQDMFEKVETFDFSDLYCDQVNELSKQEFNRHSVIQEFLTT